MFAKTQFQTQFAYHWHTNNHLLETAVQLDAAEQKEENEYGRGGIYDLFLHLFQADHGWRHALQTGKQIEVAGQEAYPDLAALQDVFAEETVAWDAFLDGLSAEEIEGMVELTSLRDTSLLRPAGAFCSTFSSTECSITRNWLNCSPPKATPLAILIFSFFGVRHKQK